MKIKLDENLPRSLATLLQNRGHDVETVVGEGLGGRDDPSVFLAASREGRLLVTLDRRLAATHQGGTLAS